MAKTTYKSGILVVLFITALSEGCTTVRHVTVVTGGSAQLYCQINNQPSNPTFYKKTWSLDYSNARSRQIYTYINDKGSITENFGQGYSGRVGKTSNDMIKLNDVTEQDGGQYSCSWEVEPEIGGCSGAGADFSVTVIVGVYNLRAAAPTPTREGKDAAFKCSASGTPPITFTWKKGGVVISNKDRWTDDGGGNRALTNTRRTDAGAYTCSANNAANKTQETDAVTLVVYYPPPDVKLESSVPSMTQQEGTHVTLTCTADGGNPTPDVTIYRDGVHRASGKSPHALSTQLTEADNNAKYVCKATSPGIDGEKTSNEMIFNVLYPPSNIEMESSLASSAQREHTKVTFTCTAYGGNPAADVTIYRGGVSKASGTSTAKLTVTLTRFDSRVVYMCKATSSAISGEMKSNAYSYYVQYAPSSVTLTSSSANLTQKEQTSVTIACRADGGDPAPDVTIYRAAVKQSSAKSTARLSRILTRSDHQVAFVCKATSSGIDGEMKSRPMRYDVLYVAKEDTTRGIKYNISAEYNQTVTITLSVIANPLPKFTWLRKDGKTESPLLDKYQVLHGILSSNLTIPYATRKDMVTYICWVKNSIGKRAFIFYLIPSDGVVHHLTMAYRI